MSKRSLADKILPKSVKDAVLRAIDPFIKLRANGTGQCSAKTQEDRRHIYLRCVAELWMLGYRIRKLESLAAKHVECLVTYWHESGHSASLMHTRLSMLRVACDRMGKFNVVKDITDYLPAEVGRDDRLLRELWTPAATGAGEDDLQFQIAEINELRRRDIQDDETTRPTPNFSKEKS